MPLSTAATGSELTPSTMEVAVRDVLAYAAGIGDTCDAVFDDARNGGVAAPPSYCVSPRVARRQPRPSGRSSSAASRRS